MWRTGLVAPQHVGSSRTRARTRVPCVGRRILNHCATREAPLPLFKPLLSSSFFSCQPLSLNIFLFSAAQAPPPTTWSQHGGYCLVCKSRHQDGECLDQRRRCWLYSPTVSNCADFFKTLFLMVNIRVCCSYHTNSSALLSKPEAPFPRISSVPFSLLSFRPMSVQEGGL